MRVGGRTRLYGILGWPVEHSLSPTIHNLWFERHGVDAAYVALPCPERFLALTLRALRGLGWGGLSVTTPHKAAVARLAAVRTRGARRLGSANTLIPAARGWRADSTDGAGVVDFVEQDEGVALRAAHVLVLGAGAAARAAVAALVEASARVDVVNRSADLLRGGFFSWARAKGVRTLALDAGAKDARLAAEALRRPDVLINATSYGLGGRDEGAPIWELTRCRAPLAVDLNYGEQVDRTAFLRLLATRGRRRDGRGVLRWQAAHAFVAWTGLAPTAADHRVVSRRLAILDRGTAQNYTQAWKIGS